MCLKIEIWWYASWLYPNWNRWERAPLALTDWLIRTPLMVFHNTETERHPFGQQLRRGWWPMLSHMGSFLLLFLLLLCIPLPPNLQAHISASRPMLSHISGIFSFFSFVPPPRSHYSAMEQDIQNPKKALNRAWSADFWSWIEKCITFRK